MGSWSTDTLILEPERYARVRGEQRAVAMQVRRRRRVPLGDTLVVEFENAETLRYQAQEMLYVERVTDDSAAAAEIAVYDRLLPTATSLSATLLIEIADQQQVRAQLARLDGVHRAVRLDIGGQISVGQDVPPPDEGPSHRTFSVHFLRFDLTPDAVEALGRGEPARLVVDHPAYRAEAPLSSDLLSLLRADLHDTIHQGAPTPDTKGERTTMASGFETVADGVTITLEPDQDGAFAISLHRGGSTVRAQEGTALLSDQHALGTVIDGMYADLLAAEHQSG